MAQERINKARADVERFLGRLVASINAGSAATLKDIDIPLLALEIISQATGIFFMMSAMEISTEVCVRAMEDSMMRIRESFQYRLQ
jgi:hypothetical protein